MVSGFGFCLFRTDIVYSGRISSIPDGYHLFRTDSVHSERMQDIRGVSGESIAFHIHLYSSIVFPVLDRTRHQFTSIPHFDQTPKVSHLSTQPDGRQDRKVGVEMTPYTSSST